MPAESGKFAIGASVEQACKGGSKGWGRAGAWGAGGCKGGRKEVGEARVGGLPATGDGVAAGRDRE